MFGASGYMRGMRGAGNVRSRPRTGTYENRYRALHSDTDGETWQEVDYGKGKGKRQRRSTGGTYSQKGQFEDTDTDTQNARYKIMSKSEFRGLSTDEKLVTMFETLTELSQTRVQKVEHRVDKLETSSRAYDARLQLMEYKSIDMEARSRRNNLIFRGHPENLESDDCVTIIRDHLIKRLGMNPHICIQRAHRLGSINPQRRSRGSGVSTQPRPIIVNFRDYEDVELILDNAKKLKNTPYGINRDYPKEIVSARSKLWPMFKKAREENSKGSVYIGYPAKLIVNRKVVADQFPDWRQVLRGSRIQGQGPTNEPDHSPSGNGVLGAADSANAPEPMVIGVNEGDSKEDERHSGNFDDVGSMSSDRSRSRSISGERSRPQSKLGPGSRTRSLSRDSVSDKIDSFIRDELVSRANVYAEKNDLSKKDKGKCTQKDKDATINPKNVNAALAKQQEQQPNCSDNPSAYDREMQRLESRLTQPANASDIDKSKTDTGQKPARKESN